MLVVDRLNTNKKTDSFIQPLEIKRSGVDVQVKETKPPLI